MAPGSPRLVGSIVSLSTDSLAFAAASDRSTVPRSAITKLEVMRGPRRQALLGSRVGAVAGLVGGAIFSGQLVDRMKLTGAVKTGDREARQLSAIGTAIAIGAGGFAGAVAGGAIGFTIRRSAWLDVTSTVESPIRR